MTRDTSAYPTLRHYITVYGRADRETVALLRGRGKFRRTRSDSHGTNRNHRGAASARTDRRRRTQPAVSAKTLGITADSDAIQRLARMDGYDDVAPSPVPSSAADEGRACAQSDSIWWPGSPVGPENGRTMKLSKSKIIGLIALLAVVGVVCGTLVWRQSQPAPGRTDRTGEHHRLPGRRENRPVR